MHYFTPIIPHAFRDQIVIELTKLSVKHRGTALGVAINEFSIFVKNYASRTPTKLAMYYALSSFEQEAVRLLTNIYLAILEMRGFNVINLPKSHLEYLDQVFLKMVRKIPGILADYKTFCKAHSKDYTEIGAKPALDNQLIDAYFKQFERTLKTSQDPFLRELIGILVSHKILTRTENDFDIDNLRFLFLLLVLKLHSIVNVSSFFSAITKNKPETGQFEDGINELILKTWPTTLEDIKMAVMPITIMAYQSMLKGDASVLKDVVEVFGKCSIETNDYISACFNIHSITTIDDENYHLVDPEKIATLLSSIIEIRNENLRLTLLSLLQAKVTTGLKESQTRGLDINTFFNALPRFLKQPSHRQQTDVFINLVRSSCQTAVILSFTEDPAPEVKRHKTNHEASQSLRKI